MARAGRLVVVALLVLVVVLLAFALTPEGRGVLSSPSAFVKDSVSLGQRIVHWPVQKVEELVARLREAGNLYEENRALRAALDRSLDLAAENERLRRENAELREALGLLPSPRDVRLIPAEVVGRNFEAWYRTVTINRGSRDGVGVGMAVRTPRGLVGIVESVAPHSAEVRLLTDPEPRRRVSVRIQSNPPVYGVLDGYDADHRAYRVSMVPLGAKLGAGQAAVTSGLGGVLAPEIPVGTVQEFRAAEDGLTLTVWLRPAQDLYELSILFVVARTDLGGEGGGP
ncbi:MAG: rod shape-determining protein MreC [Brockia lithotrophica]|nr:rod shape-determining protein MreC [Brockia lithotrophica]